jgi:phage-related minor tail protein
MSIIDTAKEKLDMYNQKQVEKSIKKTERLEAQIVKETERQERLNSLLTKQKTLADLQERNKLLKSQLKSNSFGTIGKVFGTLDKIIFPPNNNK